MRDGTTLDLHLQSLHQLQGSYFSLEALLLNKSTVFGQLKSFGLFHQENDPTFSLLMKCSLPAQLVLMRSKYLHQKTVRMDLKQNEAYIM